MSATTDSPRHSSGESSEDGFLERAGKWLTPSRRRWLYHVLLAGVPLLIVYGIMDEQTAPLWISLIASVFGMAVAGAHVPADEPTDN